MVIFDFNDQMNIIMNLIGSPSEIDLNFLSRSDIKEYCKNFGDIQPLNFHSLYPHASADAIDLLTHMLKFNPHLRFDVDQCLAHRFFDSVRKISINSDVKQIKQIGLDFEHDNIHLNQKDLRSLFLREINKFNKIEDFPLEYCFLIDEIRMIATNDDVKYDEILNYLPN